MRQLFVVACIVAASIYCPAAEWQLPGKVSPLDRKVLQDALKEMQGVTPLDDGTLKLIAPTGHNAHWRVEISTAVHRDGSVCRLDDYRLDAGKLLRRSADAIELAGSDAWLSQGAQCQMAGVQSARFGSSMDAEMMAIVLRERNQLEKLASRVVNASSSCAPKYYGCNMKLVAATQDIKAGRRYVRLELLPKPVQGTGCRDQGLAIAEMEYKRKEFWPAYASCPSL
ncbi:hypothetical protein KSF73_14490 [Burkholderiaceae bacterium DAT-1]|nr:hypothetical protein [Burkholderiaceae bacterium DAT-1]